MTPDDLARLGRYVAAQPRARATAAHTEYRAFFNGIKTVVTEKGCPNAR